MIAPECGPDCPRCDRIAERERAGRRPLFVRLLRRVRLEDAFSALAAVVILAGLFDALGVRAVSIPGDAVPPPAAQGGAAITPIQTTGEGASTSEPVGAGGPVDAGPSAAAEPCPARPRFLEVRGPVDVAPVSIRPASPPLGHFAAVAEASGARGVPLCILAALAESESSWRADARGKLGEVGLFQLTRGTWEWCGITRAQAGDPWTNADCAARYLWAMRERFGDWQSALEAFKGGPLHVERGDVSPMAQRLALRVLERAEAFR